MIGQRVYLRSHPVFRRDYAANAPADAPAGLHDHPRRTATGHQIVENYVGDIFVEDAVGAERLEIELKALQFDAGRGGNVPEDDRGEVRLPRLGTNAGEFLDRVLDQIRSPGVRVFKGLENGSVHGLRPSDHRSLASDPKVTNSEALVNAGLGVDALLGRESSGFAAGDGSIARMILAVNVLKLRLVDVRIDLRRGDVCVTEQLLDNAQVRAAGQQMRGKTMS
jgi:hypothetical protein